MATVALNLSTHAAEAPKRIDVSKLSKKVDDVVVPLPNEVFGALNKLGGVNWKEYVRSGKGSNFTERPRIALLLGTVIADGFIAVQAEDAPTVKEIGQRVLSLAKGIGVGNSITPHAKAITEAADKRNWVSVRQELDRTQNSVQQAMTEVHDEKLSYLVSLGGWLRGTEVLTAVVDKRFSEDGAELLHQPDLLTYFEDRLRAMPEFNLKLLQDIQTALGEVRPLIDVGETRISAASVKRINEITSRLDDAIVTKISIAATMLFLVRPTTAAALCVALCCAFVSVSASGSVDDAQSFALQAAEPYVKEGFQVREDYWGGDLARRREKSRAATIVQRERILVLARDGSGEGERLGAHLRCGWEAGGAAGQLAERAFRRGSRRSRSPPGAFSSSSASSNRRKSGPIGRSFTASAKRFSRHCISSSRLPAVISPGLSSAADD